MQGSLHFVSVILGAERVEENGRGNIRSFSETSRMFDYGFDNFAYKTIIDPSEPIQEVPVTLSKLDHVTVHPAKEMEILMPKGLDEADMERTITLHQESVEAPVSEGDVLGSMELSYNGKVYATVDLLAMHDVEADRLLTIWRDVKVFFARTSVRVALIVLLVLLVLFLVWKLLLSRRRYRYGRSVGYSRSRNYRGRRK